MRCIVIVIYLPISKKKNRNTYIRITIVLAVHFGLYLIFAKYRPILPEKIITLAKNIHAIECSLPRFDRWTKDFKNWKGSVVCMQKSLNSDAKNHPLWLFELKQVPIFNFVPFIVTLTDAGIVPYRGYIQTSDGKFQYFWLPVTTNYFRSQYSILWVSYSSTRSSRQSAHISLLFSDIIILCI